MSDTALQGNLDPQAPAPAPEAPVDPAADPNFLAPEHPAEHLPPIESVAEPAANPATAAAPDPSASVLRDALASRDYDVTSYDSDDALLAQLEDMTRRSQSMPEMERLARIGQQHLYDQQQQAETPPTAPPAAAPVPGAVEEAPVWQPAEYNSAWEDHIRYDNELGRYVPRDQYSNHLPAEKYNEYRRWQAETQQRMLQDPLGTLSPVFEPMIDERIAAAIEKHSVTQEAARQQASSEQFARQQMVDNAKRLMAHDAQGNMQYTQLGDPVLTREGEVLRQYAEQGRQLGITDERAIWNYADQMTKSHMLQEAQQAAGPTPEAQAAAQAAAPSTKKDLFTERLNADRLNGAGHVPNRDATIANAAINDALQNPDAALEEMFDEEIRKRGLVPTGH